MHYTILRVLPHEFGLICMEDALLITFQQLQPWTMLPLNATAASKLDDKLSWAICALSSFEVGKR